MNEAKYERTWIRLSTGMARDHIKRYLVLWTYVVHFQRNRAEQSPDYLIYRQKPCTNNGKPEENKWPRDPNALKVLNRSRELVLAGRVMNLQNPCPN